MEQRKIPRAPFCNHINRKIGTKATVRDKERSFDELTRDYPSSNNPAQNYWDNLQNLSQTPCAMPLPQAM